MLSESFWVFLKNSFIKKSKDVKLTNIVEKSEEQSKNKKRVKHVIIRSVSYESLSSINLGIRQLYVRTLVLALHCGDNIKYGRLSKHLSQRKQQYDGWKKSLSSDKLL